MNDGISKIGMVPVSKLIHPTRDAAPLAKAPAPIIAACGGSRMVAADLIDNQKWDEAARLCQKSRSIAAAVRLGATGKVILLIRRRRSCLKAAEPSRVPSLCRIL